MKRPPTNAYWGDRTFGVHDPADNTIFVIGPVTRGVVPRHLTGDFRRARRVQIQLACTLPGQPGTPAFAG